MAARGSKKRRLTSRSGRVALIVLMAVAFALRLGAGLWLNRDGDHVYRFGDSQSYRTIGDSVAAGKGFVATGYACGPSPRYADRMPGYPLVLAGLEIVCGENTVSLLVLQALLGAAAVWLAWRLGCEVHSPLAGWLAAGAMALAPWQIYFATLALTECGSAALLMATVLCVVLAVRRDALRWSALAGLSGAALVYVHPGFIGLAPAYLIVAAVAKGRRRWLVHGLVGSAIVVVALMPWWIRNGSRLGGFVPTTTRLGVSLYDGLGDGATGASDMSFERALSPQTRGLDEVAYDAWYRKKSADALWADPGRAARLAGVKFSRLWSAVPNAAEGQTTSARWASLLAFVPMVGGAMLGLMVLLRRPWLLAMLLVPVAWVTMVHLALVGSVRYRVPVEPMLWVMAATAVAWVMVGQARET
jgi:4-amino-4-deoxy-L-arabinose transferase-like glycosyltransferase